jgi:PKD repeat protein
VSLASGRAQPSWLLTLPVFAILLVSGAAPSVLGHASAGASVSAPPGRSSATVIDLRPGANEPSHTNHLDAPAVGATPDWTNSTGEMGALPSLPGGTLAYDAILEGGEFVYFGGIQGNGAPSASTWTYRGSAWTNASSGFTGAPPARYGAAMDLDPAFGGVVLVGGIDRNGTVEKGAWLLTTDLWRNLTALLPPASPEPVLAYPSVAWDPELNGLLAVGGCSDANCSVASSAAWLLNGSGWHSVASDPGPPVHSAPMAFDAADDEMIRFGGELGGSTSVSNATFSFTAGSWSNLTASSAYCHPTCVTPAAAEDGGLTWSGESQTLLLEGGRNPAGPPNDASWSFVHGRWSPVNTSNPPPGALFEAMAPNSTDVDPLALLGNCLSSCTGELLGWSWGNNPAPAFTVLDPNPADVGTSVSFEVSNYPDNGSGPSATWVMNFQDGTNTTGSQEGINFSENSGGWSILTSHAWSQSGTFGVTVNVSDFLHRTGQSSVDVTIHPALGLVVNASALQVGPNVPVKFSAVLTGGTAPVTTSWNFDDGHVASGTNATHSFASLGNYTVTAQAVDAVGGAASRVLLLHVIRVLSVSIAANWTRVDAGIPVGFVGTASGGTGTYATFAWSFGDGGSSGLHAPSHIFTGAGNYTVTLTVTDSAGANGTDRLPLPVDPPLLSGGNFTPSTLSAGAPVEFHAHWAGGTPPVSLRWLFGGGATSTNASTSFTFPQGGTYTVLLWVNDSGGAAELATLTVSVPGGGAPSSSSSNLLLLTVAGVVAALVGVAVVLLLRSRRRRASPPEPAEELPTEELPPEEPV